MGVISVGGKVLTIGGGVASRAAIGGGGGGGGKTPLTSSDLTYLGYFKVPRWPYDPDTTIYTAESDNCLTAYAQGDYQQKPLAMRLVGGVPHFFTICHNNGNNRIIEFTFSGTLHTNLSDTSGAPMATTADYWGTSVYGSKRFTQGWPSGGGSILTHGLWWDETNDVLWWSFGDGFNAANYADPCVGFAALTTPSGSSAAVASATPYGPWQIDPDNQSSQNTKGFVVELPASVQAIAGHRLAVGSTFISILGPHDFGPVLIAFDPPDTGDTPVTGYPINSDRFKPGSVDILRYGKGGPGGVDAFGNYAYTARCHRPDDYLIVSNSAAIGAPPTPNGTSPFDSTLVGAGGTSVNPDGSHGFWHHCDVISGAVWVETSSKAGMLYCGANGSGKTGYTTHPEAIVPATPEYGDRTRIWSEYYHAVMIFFSETDLLNAVNGGGYGASNQDPEIWRVTGLPTTMATRCMGAPVFDPNTRRLYSIQPYGWTDGGGYYPIVHAWEVAD